MNRCKTLNNLDVTKVQNACTGLLFVMSAPSGAGKTTLGRLLLEQEPGLCHSISYTTRSQRSGEQDGVDYHFVSEKTFRNMIDQGAFVEWAMVHGNYYGTAMADIERLCAGGRDVLLDIDVQGAEQLRKRGLDAIFIFIAPPDMEVLRQRLRQRDSDSAAMIATRMENAYHELEHAPQYDYIVINDKLSEASLTLHAIIRAEHSRALRVMPRVMDMQSFL